GILLGGDTVSSSTNFISVAAIGKSFISGKNMTRNTAKSGDFVAVTGQIGNSIAGLEISEKDNTISNKFTKKFFHPIPRINESKIAIENGIICSMDLSDGLIKDLYRICKASNVKIEIDFEKINYDQDLNNIFNENIENKILSSGEEYELILIGPASKIKNLEDKIDIKIIGRVSDSKEPILEFYKNKKIINLSTEGFDHFG
ncbi:MAG: AIR synthase-related protein, partial [Chloroflexota bacterium]|nr:AIR synthase-related protein [Chloroflexota bacterium]